MKNERESKKIEDIDFEQSKQKEKFEKVRNQIIKELEKLSIIMTQYKMACTDNIDRLNDELNREGWEPINLAMADKMVCVLFKSIK